MKQNLIVLILAACTFSLLALQSCSKTENAETTTPVAPAEKATPVAPPETPMPAAGGDPALALVNRMQSLMHSRGHLLTPEERSQVQHYDSLSQKHIHGGQRSEGMQCLENAIRILEGKQAADAPPLTGRSSAFYPRQEPGGAGGYPAGDPWGAHPGQGAPAPWQGHAGHAAGNPWNAQPPQPGAWHQAPPPPPAPPAWGHQAPPATRQASAGQPYGAQGDTASAFYTQSEAMPAARTANPMESPFGFHPLRAPGPDGYAHAQDLGVHWDRGTLYMFWFLAQPDLNSPRYDWSKYDQLMQSTPANIQTLWNISTAPDPLREPQNPYTHPGSYMPRDPEAYQAFVRAAVERYNGDGRNDMPGLQSPIKFWQVANEPDLGPNRDYARFVALTYQAIKEADPEAKVLIGGVSGFAPVEQYLRDFDNRFAPFLRELGGKYVDIFAFHFMGVAGTDYLGYKPVLEHIRRTLASCGFPPDMEIWSTETGTYSGSPTPVAPLNFRPFPPQSEADQAADLFKRYIYGVRSGIKRLFWAFGLVEGFKHDGSFFDYTGIVTPDGRKKLAYHTLKLMTRKLADADWNALCPVQEHQDSTFVYRIPQKSGSPIHVAWKDNAAGGEVSLTIPDLSGVDEVKVTSALTDQGGNPRSRVVRVDNGVLRVDLSCPVFIELQ